MLQTGGPLLLVLDDVWSEFQLTELLGSAARLPPGSQLLLASRRRDVVAAYNPTPMKLLPDASALALLAWHACGRCTLPPDVADSQVAADALQLSGGLPLTLKVLGGMLRRSSATQAAWQVSHQPLSSMDHRT